MNELILIITLAITQALLIAQMYIDRAYIKSALSELGKGSAVAKVKSKADIEHEELMVKYPVIFGIDDTE